MLSQGVVELVPLENMDALVASAKLTHKESEVVLMRYKQGKTIDSIAFEMRLDVNQVLRLERRALEEIKKAQAATVQVLDRELFTRRISARQNHLQRTNFRSLSPPSSDKSRRQIERQRRYEKRIAELKHGDKISKWFHLFLKEVGIKKLIQVCSSYLTDEQIITLAALYGKGLSPEQVRSLLKLPNRLKVEHLMRSGIQTIWDKYPEMVVTYSQS